ncbi:MAG: DUF4340 domain-containing protein, partial [Dehalococcoidia bacterium]|jgi:hypothetical protein|nr:hypothetical protein [Chloroflexota bacterium]MDP6056362.1 DUF4340 domain-containing protein [Dehalococcoidia bacterium]MDP7090045.1 DUF4340 domain-containing protein [Dehalococcoidia bacterium]MDP7261587.1 DUF4340 domain-containing protein [Dehalococcoidia bacterium]MDP7485594.1 DUF4340 domain-containing protein [Dehalococcoidia bacterium]|tara:strand:+ start:9062 stop:10075 length:1014 start_codon:yes stop_codon:yes gene_type:complete
MNLRLLLVLITVLSYVAIGVTWFITNPTEEVEEPTPPFFYTLAPSDLRNIEIDTGEKVTSWSLREDVRRWYFDDMDNIPADLFRWGGITQLLGGPRTQRVLSQNIDDPSLYGLDTPSAQFAVTLRDGSVVRLVLGDLTPDGVNNYARVEGFPQLVLVDATWGGVFKRLVNEPPVPEWYYSLNGQAREIILFDNNEVLRAYGYERDTGVWFVCDLPLETDPCTGAQIADGAAIEAELEHFGNPEIRGAVALNLEDDNEFETYGTVVESPYIAVRVENRNPTTNVTEVTRLTMTLGDLTDDGSTRYAVANETSDVIKIDAVWADRVLDLFFGDLLIDNG